MPRGEGLKKTKVNFARFSDTPLSVIFGVEEMPITEMTKKLWAFVKQNNLMVRSA